MPYAKTPSGALHYEIIDHAASWHAPAQTVLFHHGIGAAPGIWLKWLPALIDRYRIVLFDMRGYDRSEAAADQADWSMDLLARDVFAVADAADVDTFHLVGESIGGTVALACALQDPRRLASLTVSNGAHVGTNIQHVQNWASLIATQGIEGWSNQFLRDRFDDGVLPPAERRWYADIQERWRGDVVLPALSVLIGTDLSARLPGVATPTLLMHPDSSPFIPASVMADLHALLPNSTLNIWGRARHGLPFSHAAACSARLRQFLDGLRQPEAAA